MDVRVDDRQFTTDNAWINTFTGKVAFPLSPERTDYDISDIAHSLAYQCRWNGHTKRFYSVAQHCCYAYDLSTGNRKRPALMHDASETYLTDVARPIKPFLGEYKAIESSTEEIIFKRFWIDISPEIWKDVKIIDTALLIREREVLINRAKRTWGFEGVDNSAVSAALKRIPFWSPRRAELEFLFRYHQPKGFKRIGAKARIFGVSLIDRIAQFVC